MYITHTRSVRQEVPVVSDGGTNDTTETAVINDVVTTTAKFNFVDLAVRYTR